MADVLKAQRTVDWLNALIAEAERSLTAKQDQAAVAHADALAKVTEAEGHLSALTADLALAQAELDAALESEGEPAPDIHQGVGSGAAFNATITTDES